MKSGKIPEAVLKRSVLKQLSFSDSETIRQKPGIGIDASCLTLPHGRQQMLTASSMRQGKDVLLAAAAVHAAVNNIYASLGNPIGITAVITFPESFEEPEIRSWIATIQSVCNELKIVLTAGHTAISNLVLEPITAITAFGYPISLKNQVQNEWTKGTILMTGSAGKEGTARLAKMYWEELKKRLPNSFLNRAVKMFEQLSLHREIECLCSLSERKETENLFCHDCSEGGVFGALWELGEALDCGMSVDLTKISLRQETIEICEYLDLNPYQLLSGGSLLIVTNQWEQVKKALETEGIFVSVLGTLNKTKDRIIFREEEKRYLEPYRIDELFRAEKIKE